MNNEETIIKCIETKEGRLIDLQDYTLDDQDDMFYYFLGEENENGDRKLIMIGKSDVERVYMKFTPGTLSIDND